MNKETCMKEAEESILHTYNRFPVVFDHGEGVYPVSYTHLDVYKRQYMYKAYRIKIGKTYIN